MSTVTSPGIGPATGRRLLVLLTVGIAAIGAVLALALTTGGSEPAPPASAATSGPAGVAETQAMLAGVPQDGLTLGSASAPVTMIEFADLQCPFCKQYAEQVLPLVIRDYVRAGTVRLQFQPLAFIGPDSQRSALVAAAAAQQDKLWNFVHLFYFNQGAENSGFATDEHLRALTGGVAGLDERAAFAARGGRDAMRVLAEAKALAKRHQVDSTPSFVIRHGGEAHTVNGAASYDQLRSQLDDALR